MAKQLEELAYETVEWNDMSKIVLHKLKKMQERLMHQNEKISNDFNDYVKWKYYCISVQ